MVNLCCVLHCQTKSGNGNVLKLFPKCPNLRNLWIKNINREDWIPLKKSCICQLHFSPEMWETNNGEKRLKADAVPTLFPTPLIQKRKSGHIFIRSGKRKRKDISNEFDNPNVGDTASIMTEKEKTPINTNAEGEIYCENNNEKCSALSTSGTELLKNKSQLEERLIEDYENNISTNSFSALSGTQEGNANDISTKSFSALPEKTVFSEGSQEDNENDNSVNSFSTVPEKNVFNECSKEDIEKLFRKQENKIKMLQSRLQQVLHEKQELERHGHSAYKRILCDLFTEDQINVLLKAKNENNGKPQRQQWSNSTVKKALRLEFTCGNTGYDELLRQGFPLPSRRTLSRRIEHIKFEPGISDEMFKYLECKVTNFENDNDRQCSLALDEVSILGGSMFDPQTKKYIGNITLPSSARGTVNHALVFVLTGTKARWKQIIGYEYTGGGFNGKLLKPIILQIISKAESIGLRVNSVTCDMGPSNVACWNSFGITAGRKGAIKNSIPHPHPHGDENRKLFFFADVPHVAKNIVQAIINNGVIYLPEDVQATYNLPTNVVRADHLIELLEAQEDLVYTLTPNLKKDDIILPTSKNFQKMKVKRAKKILSTDVSAALYFLSDETDKLEYQTTAWFVGHIAKWFRLMTSRNLQSAISKFNITTYEETISFLEEMISLVSRIRVGEAGIFKPIQKGFCCPPNLLSS